MKDSKVLIFNTDGTLVPQKLNSIFPVKMINCRSSELALGRLKQNPQTVQKIRNACSSYFSDFTMSFFGSCDFHHLTLFMLEQLENPFYLIMFDRHYDVGLRRVFKRDYVDYSCGGWAYNALHLPNCKGGLFVGPEGNGLHRWIQGVQQLEKFQNLTTISATDTNKVDRIKKNISNIPKDCSIYISIDKDVLSSESGETDWGNGLLTENELFRALQVLISSFNDRIIGVDVCGDPRGVFWFYEITPSDILQKHAVLNRRLLKIFYSYLKDPYESNRHN